MKVNPVGCVCMWIHSHMFGTDWFEVKVAYTMESLNQLFEKLKTEKVEFAHGRKTLKCFKFGEDFKKPEYGAVFCSKNQHCTDISQLEFTYDSTPAHKLTKHYVKDHSHGFYPDHLTTFRKDRYWYFPCVSIISTFEEQ